MCHSSHMHCPPQCVNYSLSWLRRENKMLRWHQLSEETLPPPHLGNRSQEKSWECGIIDYFPWQCFGMVPARASELSDMLTIKVKMDVLSCNLHSIAFLTPVFHWLTFHVQDSCKLNPCPLLLCCWWSFAGFDQLLEVLHLSWLILQEVWSMSNIRETVNCVWQISNW